MVDEREGAGDIIWYSLCLLLSFSYVLKRIFVGCYINIVSGLYGIIYEQTERLVSIIDEYSNRKYLNNFRLVDKVNTIKYQ